MNEEQEPTPEDRTILAVVDALDGAPGEAPGLRGDETAETLARLYIEVLGLIPAGLDPVEPDPAVKDRLMAIARGEEPEAAAPEPVPVPAPVPAPAPPPRPSGEVRTPAPAIPMPPPPRAAVQPSRPSRWPLALAASLAVLFLGLSAWLYTGLVQQGETIARMTREMEAQKQRADQAAAEMQQAREQLAEVRERFSMVTSPAVEVSPMRPMGPQPDARGILFVAADHQHWYLSLQGLAPAPPGQAYKLWFEADQGLVPAGSFTAEPGAPIELSSEQMPAGTKGAMVTLEDDPQAPAPQGPEVLRAAGVFQII